MHTLLTLPMGCAIFSPKLIPQTVEAEITAVMPSQRACDAENQARYTLSNRTAKGAAKCVLCAEYPATCRHTSVAGRYDGISAKRTGNREFKVAPRIVRFSRIAFVLDRLYRSVGGTFVCAISSFAERQRSFSFSGGHSCISYHRSKPSKTSPRRSSTTCSR